MILDRALRKWSRKWPTHHTTIITGLEFKFNLHVLSLAAIRPPDEYAHWLHEVTAWLSAIAAIRLKRSTKPAPARFYFDILFDEPFGGNEIGGVMARLQLLRHQCGNLDPGSEPERLAARLRTFQAAFAKDRGLAGWTRVVGAVKGLVGLTTRACRTAIANPG